MMPEGMPDHIRIALLLLALVMLMAFSKALGDLLRHVDRLEYENGLLRYWCVVRAEAEAQTHERPVEH